MLSNVFVQLADIIKMPKYSENIPDFIMWHYLAGKFFCFSIVFRKPEDYGAMPCTVDL